MHPFKDIIEEALDEHLPTDVFLLLASFIQLRDILDVQLLQPYMYYTDRLEFGLRKPLPLFAPCVWTERLVVAPNVGVVIYSLHKLEELGMSSTREILDDLEMHTREILILNYNSYYAIVGHSICGNAFRKMIKLAAHTLSESEVDYIRDHYESDWIPQFSGVLANTCPSIVFTEGLDIILLRIISACLGEDYIDDKSMETIQVGMARHLRDISVCPTLKQILFEQPHTAQYVAEIMYRLEAHENSEIRDIHTNIKTTHTVRELEI